MVFMGGKRKNTRWRDFYRVAKWVAQGHVPDVDSATEVTDSRSK